MKTMPENDFEKQVQQKMEDLRLSPSGSVWLEVDRRIRKEKKRRIIFWLLFLALLTGGGIITGIWLNKEYTAVTVADDKRDVQNFKQENKINKNSVGTDLPFDDSKKRENSLGNENTNTNELKRSALAGNTKQPISSVKVTRRTTKEKNTVSPLHDLNNPVENKKTEHPDKNQKDILNSTRDNVVQPVQQTDSISNTRALPKNPLLGDTSKATIVDSQKGEAAVKMSRETISKKWRWGVLAQVGRSHTVKGFQVFSTNVYTELANAPSQTAGGNFSMSPVRKGISYGIGIYARRSLSERVLTNITMDYNFFSTRREVGPWKDTVFMSDDPFSRGLLLNGYYNSTATYALSDQNQTYTNKYHLIGLTGEISWLVLRSKRFQLYWDNSMSYRWVSSSNMVHYDRRIPGYYKDGGRVNRNQVFISTGLSVPISKRTTISPFAEYGLIRVNKGLDTLGTHFSNFGIRLRVLFGKKN
jgi:hypothetical protein